MTPAETLRSMSPQQLLLLSVAAALVTMALKVGAWWLTGSVGYLSDALESGVNLAGASFALAMVRLARTPPDDAHPWGHGKAEYFSAAFEGAMIFIAALAILWAAADRLLAPQPLTQLGAGTTLSVLASAINLAVAKLLLEAGRRHRSMALEADGRHLMTDVWTTAGVVVGVGLAAITGWYWLDPLVAIAVALNILREGWHLMRRSVDGLMDRALGERDQARLEAIFQRFSDRDCRFVNLRTRVSGHKHFAHVDLQVPGGWTVARAHALADAVEMAAARQGISLDTHIEPIEDSAESRAAEAMPDGSAHPHPTPGKNEASG